MKIILDYDVKSYVYKIYDITKCITKYPDGAIKVYIENEMLLSGDVTIEAHITDNDGLMAVLLVTDVLKRHGIENIKLYIPYIPYSRQDRVCNEGESFSSKIVANIINSQGYKRVVTFDAHSNVIVGMIDNCFNVSNCERVFDIIKNQNYPDYYLGRLNIVAPDLGAVKKVKELVAYIEKVTDRDVRYTVFDKSRDTKNGKIKYVSLIDGEFEEDDIIWVVDDICDGGFTFLKIFDYIRENYAEVGIEKYNINLIVSHGLYTSKDNYELLNKSYTNNLCLFDYSK